MSYDFSYGFICGLGVCVIIEIVRCVRSCVKRDTVAPPPVKEYTIETIVHEDGVEVQEVQEEKI